MDTRKSDGEDQGAGTTTTASTGPAGVAGPLTIATDGAAGATDSPRTIATGEAASAGASDGFPVTSHYELLELLGAGAMGKVYKARDRRDDRVVAIKFVIGADPRAWMRFRAEAKALERIKHPNVCQLYEVDEVAGRPYIVMQLVDGKPLREAAADMALGDRIAAVRDAALAIEEAHHQGVVHRDITPANVMVEQRADRWVAVVMDFGLARETAADSGLTESGTVLGTPAYMSPEQARGDVRAIDRRADIYGLGATLYEVLTGRPPFAGESRTAVLTQVIHDDPVAPRRVVPSLEIDLEIIALKCLAKEPAQRYASAQELADDLDRYLARESILGRRPTLWHRLRRRARRHRSLVVLGAVSLATVLVVGALGTLAWLSERARTAEHTALAERLGREAKDIELFMRSSAYQLPLQDVRPMRQRVRALIAAIAATRHELGTLGDAVVRDALGRGHLALHEWQEAADELSRAAEVGAADLPGFHAARGRALGELYHGALEEARMSGNRAWLASRKQQLERQYIQPALAELKASRAASQHYDQLAGDEPDHLDVLISLYRGEFATAEQSAVAAIAKAPWQFELFQLAGDAAYGAAMAAFDHGDEHYATARRGLEHAESLYAKASEAAPSDSSIYEAAAQSALQRAEADARQNQSARDALTYALDQIDRALRADPDRASAHTTRAYILLRRLRTPELRGGQDERTLLKGIAEEAVRAVGIDPNDARAWDALGNAHVFRGNYESYHSDDGMPWWQRAFDDFHTALALRPNYPWANKDLGMAHRWIGSSLSQTGHDPMPDFQATLQAYQRAVDLDPNFVFARAGQADVYAEIAEHQTSRGGDPQTAAEAARTAGEKCLNVDPNFATALDAMARAQLALAGYLLDTRGDPSHALGAARSFLERADRLRPDYPHTLLHRVTTARLTAELRLRDGGDPVPALAEARPVCEKLLRDYPDSPDNRIEAARLDLAQARSAAHSGLEPAPFLASATVHASKAKELDPQFAETYLVAAEVCVEAAGALPSRDALTRCDNDLKQALRRNPALVKAQRLSTRLDKLLHTSP